MKEENTPQPKNEILKKNYDSLNENEKELFLEEVRDRVHNEYRHILPKGVETHTIALKNGLGCIIKPPNAHIMGKVLNKISSFSGDPDMVGAGRIIYDNCLVVADEKLANDEFSKLAAYLQCINTVNIIEGSIKKN